MGHEKVNCKLLYNHSWNSDPVYLLVVLDLVVQDGSMRLFGLLPGESDGVLSGPVLLHRCHQRWTWEECGQHGGVMRAKFSLFLLRDKIYAEDRSIPISKKNFSMSLVCCINNIRRRSFTHTSRGASDDLIKIWMHFRLLRTADDRKTGINPEWDGTWDCV